MAHIHILQEHVSHLDSTAEEELKRLLQIIVDVENLFMLCRNGPFCSDRQVWANCVDPDQTAHVRTSLYCLPFCLHFWSHYSVVKNVIY